ncbi:MAG: site-2 protease family protein [Phycisphaerales bacterium]
MTQLAAMLGTVFDLLLVVLGFSLIVFVHELGHFLAARWAGIRVLAFAIGFGPAMASYRKGLGWRRGSSEPEYHRLVQEAQGERGEQREAARAALAGRVSPTEYRVNWLPFGGYVKMLGQEDLNPEATSDAPDSYQNTPVPKRLVVISAGVVMNVVAAALLFMFVFMVGLKTEPPRIGAVAPGSPASKAGAKDPGVEAGLKPGDEIAAIDGRAPNSFNDLVLASAMARKGSTIEIAVRRSGHADDLRFALTPEQDPATRLMTIGVEPARSPTLFGPDDGIDPQQIRDALKRNGLAGIEPGMTLVRIGDDRDIAVVQELADAVRASGGEPVEAEFAMIPAGGGAPADTATAVLHPRPAFPVDRAPLSPTELTPVEHVLGLVPVLTVDADDNGSNAKAHKQGLKDGDIFARLGALEFPGQTDGIAEVRRHRGTTIPVVVLRADGFGGALREVVLNVRVSREGLIGFRVGNTGDTSALLARPLGEVVDGRGKLVPTAAARLNIPPGSRVLRVGGTMVADFTEMLAAVRDATAPTDGAFGDTTVRLLVELPHAPIEAGAAPPRETVDWALAADDCRRLHDAGWTSGVSLGLFRPEEFSLRASGPGGAVMMGLEETRRVMLMTYITFARLFEGTVKVEHLKGPVGIAHLGTRIADRGLIWLLFFMALISVNLAVVNFLPLPIVDGGQFLFLLYELIRGRPVSVAFQNVATAAGLMLIGAVFLIVTFNDIANLFG